MDRTTKTLITLGGAAAGAAAYHLYGRPRIRNWGSHAGEVRRSLPGDDLVGDPEVRTTRAVTVDAPPEAVWPWVVQMGQRRGGFYSYDGLERFAGLGIENADRIHPEWQDVEVGEKVYLSPSAAMIVVEIEPEEAFVLFREAPVPGWDRPMRWSWAFVLQPVGTDRTRLLVRTRVSGQPDGLLVGLLETPMEILHFVMERGMLQGVKERVETADRSEASNIEE
jgi:hypothetical protein